MNLAAALAMSAASLLLITSNRQAIDRIEPSDIHELKMRQDLESISGLAAAWAATS